MPTKVTKWLPKLSTKIAYQRTKVDYWASHFWQFQMSNQL
jgi:hypothetical protein